MMLALMVFVARCIQYVRDAVKGGADDGRIEPPAPEREPKRYFSPSNYYESNSILNVMLFIIA